MNIQSLPYASQYANQYATNGVNAPVTSNQLNFGAPAQAAPVASSSVLQTATPQVSGGSGGSSILGGIGSALSAFSPQGGSGGGGSVLGGLGAVAGIAGGISDIIFGAKAAKLAKKNYKFQVGAYNENLKNTTQSYNTALEDRINARHVTEGKSTADTSNYLNKHSLKATTLGT